MFFDRSLYVFFHQSIPNLPTKYTSNHHTNYSSHSRLAMGNVRHPHTTQPPTSLPANRPQLTPPQILFLIGLTLIIGVQKTIVFFTRPQKLKGTAAFSAGIILILIRWPLTGFLIELYGLFILFGDFLVTIGQFAGNIPVIGPYIKRGLEVLAGGRSNAELPV